MEVLNIYKKLLRYFGSQGWWPIFDKKSQKYIYHNSYDRNSCDISERNFEICAGAILTQNTAWKNVEKTLGNLCPLFHSEHVRYTQCKLREESHRNIAGDSSPAFAGAGLPPAPQNDKEWLTPQFILSCKDLEKLIQPAGYYNQKAKKLRIFAQWWINKSSPLFEVESNGAKKSASLSLVSCRLSLLSLWGIGPETADSMLLYAFNKPIFVIDAYTKRLCKEFGIEFKTYDEYRQFFESQLPKSAKLFNEYHALIVAWGKLHAKDKILAKKIIS